MYEVILLAQEEKVQKYPRISVSSMCNISKILLIITSVCHLVCVEDLHCYCIQISYCKNAILSSQFPHQHVEIWVSNRLSFFFFFFKMQIEFSHLLGSLTFLRDLFLYFDCLCIYQFYSQCSSFMFFLQTSSSGIHFSLAVSLACFCFSFLRALPSYVGSTDFACYFRLSLAQDK